MSNLAISLAAPSTLLAREGDRQLHQSNLGWDEGGGGREERGGEGKKQESLCVHKMKEVPQGVRLYTRSGIMMS